MRSRGVWVFEPRLQERRCRRAQRAGFPRYFGARFQDDLVVFENRPPRFGMCRFVSVASATMDYRYRDSGGRRGKGKTTVIDDFDFGWWRFVYLVIVLLIGCLLWPVISAWHHARFRKRGRRTAERAV
jgi:hypothetical protein